MQLLDDTQVGKAVPKINDNNKCKHNLITNLIKIVS